MPTVSTTALGTEKTTANKTDKVPMGRWKRERIAKSSSSNCCEEK